MAVLINKFPLLPRKKNTDKSRYGHVLILAGSKGMTGAAMLACRAAIGSGSGLVTLGCPQSLENLFARTLVEVMQLGLPETEKGALSGKAYQQIIEFVQRRKINAVAIGPGLSVNAQTQALVRRLLQNLNIPIVLDADGLNSFKGKVSSLRDCRPALVLTPHKREFERLFSKKWPEAEAQRIQLAKELSKFYDVTLVLKGFRSLVVGGNKVFVNETGNPGMAKGGSGDVLTGMITSFIGQGLDPFDAARWAVHAHGLAGDLAVRQKGELGLIASDLIEYLPRAFKKISLE